MNSEVDNAGRGIRWNYREVLRGKSGVIMAIELVLVIIALIVFSIAAKDSMKLGTLCASLINDLITLKANKFAVDLCSVIALSIPFMLALWLVIAGVLTIVLNIRDRNVERTPENLEEHRIFSQRAWTWPWSIQVGVFDFCASFVILNCVFTLLGGDNLTDVAQKVWAALFTVVCLVFAERRVTRASRTMAGLCQGNYDIAAALLAGRLDDRLPEDYRCALGRAKAATVVRIGIFRSPEWAVLVAKGIGLRTKVKLFSGFLNSAIHGMLTAVSFGIAATAANTLGAVGGEFAASHGKEYGQLLLERPKRRPWFIVEIIAVVICIVAATEVMLVG